MALSGQADFQPVKSRALLRLKGIQAAQAVAFLAFLSSTTGAFAGAPTLFFADFPDGQRTGGDTSAGSSGSFVCVWGKNFGATRGTSTITIGGSQIGRYMSWEDPTPTLPGMSMAKACFQLGTGVSVGAGQNVVLTTSAGASNGIPFTVRPDPPPGRANDLIYCVDANHGSDSNDGHFPSSPAAAGQGCFATPQKAVGYGQAAGVVQSGQIYVRAGVFTSGWDTDLGGRASAYAGIASYPGEVAQFGVATNPDIGISNGVSRQTTSSRYFVYANLKLLHCHLNSFSGYVRMIGNDIRGYNAGNGSIVGVTNPRGQDFGPPRSEGYAWLYGNNFHDNQMDQGSATITGVNGTSITLQYTAMDYSNGWLIPTLGGGNAFTLEPVDPNNVGTPPSCTGSSPLCVSGHLFTGLPRDNKHWYTAPTHSTSNPQTITLADLATNTPITLTDAGTGGGWMFAQRADSLNHVLYVINSFDHVDVGWNAWIRNKVGKQLHFYNESGGCSPTCGWYYLHQPVTAAQQAQSLGVSPVITEVPASPGACGGHPCANARDYWVNWTYQSPQGETVPSHPIKFHVDANSLLHFGSPLHNNGNLATSYPQQIYTGSPGRFGTAMWMWKITQNVYNVSGFGSQDCLQNIAVAGGLATVNAKTNMTAAGSGRTNACPKFTDNPPCYGAIGCDTAFARNPGPYAAGQAIGIVGSPSIAGRYTVASVDPGGYRITFSCPGCPDGTYTDSALELARFNDYGWSVYAIDASAGGGTDNTGWKQNGQPILIGTDWQEPVTGLVTSTSNPPTLATQTGGDGTMSGYSDVKIHGNWINDGALFLYLHGDPFLTGNPVYNNVFINMQATALIDATGPVQGTMPAGTALFYNNTIYNSGGGIQHLDSDQHFPLATTTYSNNLIWLAPWASDPNQFGYNTDYGGYARGLTLGSANIWHGQDSSNPTVTSTSGLTNNLFQDPGLVNPGAGDFHIASTSSPAHTTAPSYAGVDLDGVARPQNIGGTNYFDIGAYVYNAGYVPPCTITTLSLPAGTVGQPYSAALSAANCGSSSWAQTGGTLPAGLSLDPRTGAIAGTPTSAGTSSGLIFTYASATSSALSISIASTISCDLNGDGVVDAADVQIAMNQALGTAPCGSADLQQNGQCNVIDVQRVANASLGAACKIGP